MKDSIGREMICRAVARRAGGRITINGRTGWEDDAPEIRVTNVDKIDFLRAEVADGSRSELRPVATDKNGVEYVLI